MGRDAIFSNLRNKAMGYRLRLLDAALSVFLKGRLYAGEGHRYPS